jgi:tetratricopeptide (TPR) repeat protein
VAAEEALNEALQRRLLRASGHHRYIFRPVDVAKSLADSLPPPRRRELHQKIANILIEMQGDPLQIGYHYEQAGLSGEAAQYLAQAGARAMAANAINQAIKCYRRAVELVESQSSYEALGNLHRQQGAWSESVNAFKQALEMAQKSGDVDKQAQLQNNLAFTLWLADEYKEASDYASEVLKVERVSPIEQATAQSHLGMIAWVLGHFREAENWCQKAVAMLTESGDEARLAGAYNRLGLVYFSQGKFAEAAQLTQQALATREKFDDRWGKAYCLVSLGRIAAEQGNFESATTHFTQAQELFETIGSNDGLLVVYTEQGRTQLLQGAAGEAMPLLSQALQLAQNLGKRSAYSMGDIYLLIAQANLKQGQIDRAKASMDSALKLVESAGNQAFVAAGRALMAQIYTAQNKPAPADKMYQAAIGLFEKVGNPAGLLRTKVAYARFLAGQGKSDIAATMEQEARSQAESIGLYI